MPLRRLIKKIDGETLGPHGFKGPIGKQLENCELLPVIKFKAIEGENISVDKDDLSCDQKYLFDIYKAVISGFCSEDLASRQPGKMNHARWLTTANRILRVYVSTKEPSNDLIDIVTFIKKVYAPMWFEIKQKSSIAHGSRHIYNMIKKSKDLNDRIWEIVRPVIERNAYFCHPENIIIGLINDSRRIAKVGLAKNFEGTEK